jgi:chitinase
MYRSLYRLMRPISLCLVLCALSGHAQQAIVVGYYPMWAKGTLSPSKIVFPALTHVNHAFAWPNSDGTLAFDDPAIDTALINATHRAGKKILLSLGGAGEVQTANFSLVCADSTLRRKFISALVHHLTSNGYDGADLDWEGPASNADKANEVALVRELRSALNAADTSLLLTMAVGVGNWSQQWRDFDALDPLINWFGAMTYDFYGSWSSTSGHNSPVYAPSNTDGCIQWGIGYLTGIRGVSASKLLLGLPFYGKMFSGTASLYAPYTSCTYLGYSEIVTKRVQQAGWAYVWDALSQVPYLTNQATPAMITFDDSLSIAGKCDYAKTNGLAGVMIWEITLDVLPAGQPLLGAVAASMNPATSIPSEAQKETPAGTRLIGNYPNPFNPTTVVSYRVQRGGNVRLAVYDPLGREVALLVDGYREPGEYRIGWNAAGHASGAYITRLTASGTVQSKTMILVR